MDQRELAAPARTEGMPPARRARSLRRTASWQTCWPSGIRKPTHMLARARDLYSFGSSTPPLVAREDWFAVSLSPQRLILDMAASRRDDALQALVGLRPGGPVRKALRAIAPEEVERGTPLNLLLDDLAGATLVTPGAWMAWTDDWRDQYRAAFGHTMSFDGDVTGVCIGFRPRSLALTEAGGPDFARQSNVDASPPIPPDDPYAWHDLPDQHGPNHRRSRRLDLWVEDGFLRADVWFQDSNALPSAPHLRRIVHEYRVHVRVDPQQLVVMSLDVTPAVLPYAECRGGVVNAALMVGRAITDFRLETPATLPGAMGCTHLNDLLRGLQDLGPMADLLDDCIAEEERSGRLAPPISSC